MIIAHRGYSERHKDNSIDSFKAAISSGFDMIELDLNICKTGELVIYHDFMINNQSVNSYTLHELESLGVVSLDKYFKLVNNSIRSYLDIKGDIQVTHNLIKYLYLNKNIDLNLLYIGSFDNHQLNLLVKSNLPVKYGLITANKYTYLDMEYYFDKVNFMSFCWEYYDNKIYDILHEQNISVYLYTCTNKTEEEYITRNFKYDGIVSNIFIKN